MSVDRWQGGARMTPEEIQDLKLLMEFEAERTAPPEGFPVLPDLACPFEFDLVTKDDFAVVGSGGEAAGGGLGLFLVGPLALLPLLVGAVCCR